MKGHGKPQEAQRVVSDGVRRTGLVDFVALRHLEERPAVGPEKHLSGHGGTAQSLLKRLH